MSAKTNKTETLTSLTEEEEEYPLNYNMYDNTININCAEGSTVNITFQTGRPKDPKPPVP